MAGRQYVNTEGMANAIAGIVRQISNINNLVESFDSTAQSLSGTTFGLKESVESSLSNVVKSYQTEMVPVVEKMKTSVENVKNRYITSLSGSSN